MTYCTKCGMENEDSSSFCIACGSPLDELDPVPNNEENLLSPKTVEVIEVSENADDGISDESVAVNAEDQLSDKGAAVEATKTVDEPEAQKDDIPREDDPSEKDAGVVIPEESKPQLSKKTMIVVGIIAAVVAVGVIVGLVCSLGNAGVAVKNSVDEYSWEELSAISEEIANTSDEAEAIEVAKKYHLTTANGTLDGTQVKTVPLANGQFVQVQVAGFVHDDKTDGGKAGITFIFKDAISAHDMNGSNTNVGGWADSQMRAWLTTDGMNLLPSDLQNVIVSVDKKTNNSGEANSSAVVTITADSLWLFSAVELCGNIDWAKGEYAYVNSIWNSEGAEYKLFRDLSVKPSSPNMILIKALDGNPCNWWGRSPHPVGANSFIGTSKEGGPNCGWDASSNRGVVPGFCI